LHCENSNVTDDTTEIKCLENALIVLTFCLASRSVTEADGQQGKL